MTSRDVCVDGFTEVKTDAVGESRGSAENGGERNGRRLSLASTETEIAQQVFTNGEERNGHGDVDLDDCCKVTRTACFTNRPTIAATDLGYGELQG